MTVNGNDPRGMLRSQRALQPKYAVPSIAPDDHEQMKEHLRPALKDFCDALIDGIAKRDRTAMNLYPRIMGTIGAEREVNVNLVLTQVFGMTESEVRGIIEAHRASSAVTLDECEADGVALCLFVIGESPERRSAILEALGGKDARMALEAPAGTNGG